MGWQPDDNTRSALHYLLLGIAVVAFLVAGDRLLDHLYPGMDPGFGHGYLLDQENGPLLIDASTGRGERLVTVLFLAFASASIIAGGAWLPLRNVLPRSRNVIILVWWTWSAMVGIAGVHAALFVPPMECVGIRDDALIIWRRTVLLNDIPLPRSRVIQLVPFAHVEEVAVVKEAVGAVRERVRVELRLKDGQRLTLGSSAALPDVDGPVTIFAEERARLVRLILHGNAH